MLFAFYHNMLNYFPGETENWLWRVEVRVLVLTSSPQARQVVPLSQAESFRKAMARVAGSGFGEA